MCSTRLPERGKFITRLLQSGLIRPEDAQRKYDHELHANELVLLAYYIAAVNIELVFQEAFGGEYRPFPESSGPTHSNGRERAGTGNAGWRAVSNGAIR